MTEANIKAPKCKNTSAVRAYRRRFFLRAAAMRSWIFGAGFAASVLFSLLMPAPASVLDWAQRIGYPAIALAYWAIEIHYGARLLRARHQLFLARLQRRD